MTLLAPGLMQQLTRTRLRARTAHARAGIGERPAGVASSGIEFVDHRPYEPGDDLRHVDPHIFARTGQHVVRQFVSNGPLDVTVLVDRSASMRTAAGPTKWRIAAQLAGALATSAVHGGDRVSVGAFAGADVAWHPTVSTPRGLPALFAWLERHVPEGATDFMKLAVSTSRHLRAGGLLIVISDWLADDPGRALGAWHDEEQELVAIHVVAPEEIEPERMGTGPMSFVDVESGARIEVVLDERALARYRADFARWSSDLLAQVTRRDGRYVRVRSDAELAHVVLTDLRTCGLIT